MVAILKILFTFAVKTKTITMKQLKPAFIASLIFITGAFMSCNQSGQTTTEVVAVADSTAAQTPPVETKTIAMVISHHVKDYSTWRPFFDKDETNRQAANMKILGVFQDAADPNYVSVSASVPSVEAAKQFSASEALKKAMTEAGVTDQPEVKFYEFQFSDAAAGSASDNRLFVVAKVQDYQTWKTVFDSRDSIRAAAGVTTVVVAKNLDDANEVAVAFTASDMQTLKNFMQGADVKEGMQKAGVVGEPMIQFATKAKETPM